jgi:hypothetical protein
VSAQAWHTLPHSASYTPQVKAVDKAGNEGPVSPSVTFTVDATLPIDDGVQIVTVSGTNWDWLFNARAIGIIAGGMNDAQLTFRAFITSNISWVW